MRLPPLGLSRQKKNVQRSRTTADGWAMTPSGTRGVLNDALSIYFGDATLASAFAARWCVGAKAETTGGYSRCARMNRNPRVEAGLHRTP
jgi:hypothetical protein